MTTSTPLAFFTDNKNASGLRMLRIFFVTKNRLKDRNRFGCIWNVCVSQFFVTKKRCIVISTSSQYQKAGILLDNRKIAIRTFHCFLFSPATIGVNENSVEM
jgi:hypothetical protein